MTTRAWRSATSLPLEDRDDDLAHDVERLRAHLVRRVLGRVPVWIVEIDDVDRADPHVVERHMVVADRWSCARNEDVAVAQFFGDVPHPRDHLRRKAKAVPLPRENGI